MTDVDVDLKSIPKTDVMLTIPNELLARWYALDCIAPGSLLSVTECDGFCVVWDRPLTDDEKTRLAEYAARGG